LLTTIGEPHNIIWKTSASPSPSPCLELHFHESLLDCYIDATGRKS
jgi:hypothetical protein